MKRSLRCLLSGLAFASLGYSSFAVNLVSNGDFEAGLSGFTSDYVLADGTSGSLFPESVYLVGTDPSLYHGLFTSYGDHTTGSGNMFIANGAGDTSKIVWETSATIAVTPGTLYYFEAWMSSAHPASPGSLSFKLSGDVSDAILGTGTAPATTGIWTPVSHTWHSGLNTSVTLFLQNANSASFGNDFAIDDIHFGETSSISVPDASSSLTLAGMAFAFCGLARRRFGRA
jgi:hypothetical protein